MESLIFCSFHRQRDPDGGGNIVIGVLCTDDISLSQKRADAHIIGISVKAPVVPDHTFLLSGKIVDAKQCAGGHTHHTVHRYMIFHKHIQNAGGKHPTHRAAFQNQTSLHRLPLSLRLISPGLSSQALKNSIYRPAKNATSPLSRKTKSAIQTARYTACSKIRLSSSDSHGFPAPPHPRDPPPESGPHAESWKAGAR